jgi:hypothetical protein
LGTHPRRRHNTEATIKDDAERVTAAAHTARQPGIIISYGFCADEDGIYAITQFVHYTARLFSTDPLRVAARGSNAAV